MPLIATENHGQLIVSSTFWDQDSGGKLYCSCNAGAVRVLIPAVHRGIIDECRTSRRCIISRGPCPSLGLDEAVEILFDDGTPTPFVLQFSPSSFDMLPAEPEPGREWVVALWIEKKGKPHKALERAALWQRVPIIGDMA